MDTIEAVRASENQGLLSKLPSRLHHNAFVVKDHEINRRFFEDLLGIPLVATWCEKNFSAELQREVEFCHTFFAMADGGALAFFVPSEAGDDAVAVALVFDFEHHALVGLVGSRRRLGDDAVETRALEATKPVR